MAPTRRRCRASECVIRQFRFTLVERLTQAQQVPATFAKEQGHDPNAQPECHQLNTDKMLPT